MSVRPPGHIEQSQILSLLHNKNSIDVGSLVIILAQQLANQAHPGARSLMDQLHFIAERHAAHVHEHLRNVTPYSVLAQRTAFVNWISQMYKSALTDYTTDIVNFYDNYVNITANSVRKNQS